MQGLEVVFAKLGGKFRRMHAVIRAAGLPSTVADGYSLELPSAAGTARIGLPAEPIPDRVFYRLDTHLVR